MSFTCVVTSDNHLDAYYEKMRPVQLEERRKRILSNFNKTVEYALENGVDYYFNCGDLFDRATPRNPAVSRNRKPSGRSGRRTRSTCTITSRI